MADGTRLLASAVPVNPFVVVHECLSGYTEATRLALERRTNIYDNANHKTQDGGPRFIVRRDGAAETYDQVQVKALFAGGRTPRVAVVHVDEYEYPRRFCCCPMPLGRLSGTICFGFGPFGSVSKRSCSGRRSSRR
jgi:hypothetical protein